MKALISFFLVSLVFTGSVVAADKILDNTSMVQKVKIKDIPNGDLVHLQQTDHGSDPFDFFDQGLEIDEDNRLNVENDNGILDISLAGGNYKDKEKDNYNQVSIKPLAFDSNEQRYLITNKYEGKDAYQILINVDRREKKARVFMREVQNGKWSAWEYIVSYGRRLL